jgi:hypothetical protein
LAATELRIAVEFNQEGNTGMRCKGHKVRPASTL